MAKVSTYTPVTIVQDTDKLFVAADVGGGLFGDRAVTGQLIRRQLGAAGNIASVDPTSSDDASAGYRVGSLWYNETADKLFLCTDSTTSAAAWTEIANKTESFVLACSDETSNLAVANGVAGFHAPYAFTLTGIKISVNTAPTGSALIVDVKKGGVSILSTLLSIDADEKTSTTALTPAVISTSAIEDNAEITVDITQVGSTTAGKGLKLTMLGYKTL